MFLTGTVNTPPPTTLPNDNSGEIFSYMLVADEAFPLKTYIMRPYAGRLLDDDSKTIFNYRLSILRASKDTSYCPPGFTDSVSANGDLSEGVWRTLPVSPLEGLTTTSRSINIAAVQVRERLREYFAGNGSVDWQMRVINRR